MLHAGQAPRLSVAHLFDCVSDFLLFCGRQSVVGMTDNGRFGKDGDYTAGNLELHPVPANPASRRTRFGTTSGALFFTLTVIEFNPAANATVAFSASRSSTI